MRLIHEFKPIIFQDSEILILGSFPSVQSRFNNFYYMNKQNRFWQVLSSIYNTDFVTISIEEKITKLKENKIAIYDVCKECEIKESNDATIKNVIPIDLEILIRNTNITRFFLNGKKAYALFVKYFPNYLDRAVVLPSTSPSNASYSLESLIELWQVIK